MHKRIPAGLYISIKNEGLHIVFLSHTIKETVKNEVEEMNWANFGIHIFSEEKMARYLTAEQLEQVRRGGRISMETADAVAEAMKNWALEQGITATGSSR